VNTKTRDLIVAELKAARDLADAATAAGRDFTDEERAAVDAHLTKARELKKGADNQDELHKQLAELTDGLGAAEPTPKAQEVEQFRPRSAKKTLGQTFVDSLEFKALVQSAPNGHFGEKSRVQSAPMGLKALLTGTDRDASAGALLTPQSLGFLTPYYERPLSLRSLVSGGSTGTDVIEYVQLLAVTNNAAPVPEALATGAVGSGTAPNVVTTVTAGVKPESGMTFVKGSTTVKTVAHWMPATKRALSDAAQIRTLIDSFLEYGLEEELEDQILSGDGTGENFLGLDHVSGVQTQAAGTDDIFGVTRKARTKARLIGRVNPTAYAMHPNDWQKVDLAKNAQGAYYGSGPFALTSPRLWGLPVVESEVIPEGTAWCADWKQAVLLDREQATIQVTDSHADFFVRNLVAILAELRAAFVVLRPPAFVKITLPA
jgi:HK97 family phage major capsid protein